MYKIYVGESCEKGLLSIDIKRKLNSTYKSHLLVCLAETNALME
jgi:hypothetical protein